jgi:hypothetical protein
MYVPEVYTYTLVDFLYAPFLLFFIFYFAKSIRDKRIAAEPEFKYFLPAIIVKILGAITVVIVYTLYYKGGDTNYYFNDGRGLVRLLFKRPDYFGDILINGVDYSKFYYFDEETGYPTYYRSSQTYFVVRLTWPFVMLGLQSFICTCILLAIVSFGGIWRMYRVFIMEFPDLTKQFAFAFFFVPSVFFWGSGLLKDTITFSAIGYFFFSFYMAFIKRHKVLLNIFILYLSLMVIINIKPYIFIGLLPGTLIWIISHYTSKIQGNFIRGITFPSALIIGFACGYLLLLIMGDELGKYTLDKLLNEASVSNYDLKQSYYKGNSFDIGKVDGTVEGMLGKALPAINAALFRPYIWESNSFLMIISGIENLVILFFTIYTLYRLRIFRVFSYFTKNNLLTFSLIFSLFFAFSVGISTSNFGSLVRYRIPLLPFYIASLYIINHLITVKKKEVKKRNYLAYEAHA